MELTHYSRAVTPELVYNIESNNPGIFGASAIMTFYDPVLSFNPSVAGAKAAVSLAFRLNGPIYAGV